MVKLAKHCRRISGRGSTCRRQNSRAQPGISRHRRPGRGGSQRLQPHHRHSTVSIPANPRHRRLMNRRRLLRITCRRQGSGRSLRATLPSSRSRPLSRRPRSTTGCRRNRHLPPTRLRHPRIRQLLPLRSALLSSRHRRQPGV